MRRCAQKRSLFLAMVVIIRYAWLHNGFIRRLFDCILTVLIINTSLDKPWMVVAPLIVQLCDIDAF